MYIYFYIYYIFLVVHNLMGDYNYVQSVALCADGVICTFYLIVKINVGPSKMSAPIYVLCLYTNTQKYLSKNAEMRIIFNILFSSRN